MLQFSFGHQEKSREDLEPSEILNASLILMISSLCWRSRAHLQSYAFLLLLLFTATASKKWNLGLSLDKMPAFSPSPRPGCAVSGAWLFGCCHIRVGGVCRLTGVCPTIFHTNNSASGVKYYKSFFFQDWNLLSVVSLPLFNKRLVAVVVLETVSA